MRTEQMPRSWRDARSVSLLGMGTALPGPPVPTDELLDRLQSRFEVDVRRRDWFSRLGSASALVTSAETLRPDTKHRVEVTPSLRRARFKLP